jgi:hypothetical protein
MLFYQIYNIDYAPKYPLLKLKISTIQGWLAYGAHRTVVLSYQLHLPSQTELLIQLKKLLFDDVYLFKVVDNNKSWEWEWKCLISFAINFSPFAWGTSQ